VLSLGFVVADLSRPWNVPSAILSAILTGEFGIFRSWMTTGMVLLSVAALLLFLTALRHTVN